MTGFPTDFYYRHVSRPPPVIRSKPDDDAYYRQCLSNLESHREEKNVSKNFKCRYGKVHPPMDIPLYQVQGELAAMAAKIRTPKQAAKIEKGDGGMGKGSTTKSSPSTYGGESMNITRLGLKNMQ